MTLKAPDGQPLKELEIAASYLVGHDPTSKLQYHADITVVFSPHPKTDAADAARLCPDYFAAPTLAQLEGSEKCIVVGQIYCSRCQNVSLTLERLACVMLGEIAETNKNCWVHQDPQNPDVTTNIKIQIELSEKEEKLREIMYQAT